MGDLTPWLQEALAVGFMLAVMLVTLGYSFISNISQAETSPRLIWNSLTMLPATSGGESSGILAMVLTSWLIGAVLLTAEALTVLQLSDDLILRTWLKMLAVTLGISFALAFIYWFWQAGSLIALSQGRTNTLDAILTQVKRSEDLLKLYYLYFFALLFALGVLMPHKWPQANTRLGIISYGSSAGLLVLTITLISYTNLRVIQADIAFKTGDTFARQNAWEPAIAVYNRARELAPNEDYYYLFLGRAYLEHARLLSDPVERDRFIAQAAEDLKRAQALNPLNTDHTANLGRLHSLWASFSNDPNQAIQLAGMSEDYFSDALMLSPHNARLWDEWALLYLNILNLPDVAYEKLQQALALDPSYDWSYGLLGDYYARYVAKTAEPDSAEQREALQMAVDSYWKAFELAGSDNALKATYALASGGINTQLGNYETAIVNYEAALELAGENPNRWQIEDTLARLYAQTGNIELALFYAQQALEHAPEEQKERAAALIQQLGGVP